MRIEQCRPSRYMTVLGQRFMDRYALAPYTDPDKPAIFFGCYYVTQKGVECRADIDAVLKHRSFAAIIWTGSDIMRVCDPAFAELRARKNVHHIANSSFIASDLFAANLPFVNLPLCASNLSMFSPMPKGPCVYSYLSHSRPELYGNAYIPQIRAAIPDLEIIEGYSTPPGNHAYEQMPAIYARCFMGLRLTLHDGFPNTVVEMGVMGRPCLWNAYMPNAIPWFGIDDIVDSIREERKHVGEMDVRTADRCKAFMDVGDGWLHTSFYEAEEPCLP